MAERRLELGGWVVDLDDGVVHQGDEQKVELSSQEVRILTSLVGSAGVPRTRGDLLVELWPASERGGTRAVDKAMFRLRNKIEKDPASPRFLKSVRGLGYVFELERSSEPFPVTAAENGIVTLHDTRVDLRRLEALSPHGFSTLTPLEGKLIEYLLAHGDRAVGEDELLQSVWGYKEGIETRAIDHLIRRLRKKLEGDGPRILVTVRGKGWTIGGTARRPAATLDDTLPGWPDAFGGRDELLAALLTRVRGGERVLVLVGPPGVGKTRLAVKLARELKQAGQVTGALVHCPLHGESDAGDLTGALGRALGTVTADESSLIAVLATRGGNLVLIDDVDRLDATAWSALGRWVDRIPDLVVIATSTRRTAVASIDVPPLAPADAVALYRARAGLRVEALLDSVVLERVQSVDFLPLAIELLARSPSGDVSRSPSSDPLQAAFQDAWSELDAHTRRALVALSSFVGSFDVDAAEAVAGADAGAAIELLHARSLLRVVVDELGEARFDLYHSLRRFIVDRATPDEQRLAETAFVDWAARAARDQMGRIGVDGGRALHRHEASLHAAAHRALDRGSFDAVASITQALLEAGRFRGFSSAFIELVDRFVEMAPTDARARHARAWIHFVRLELSDAAALASELPDGFDKEILLSVIARRLLRHDAAVLHARSARAMAAPKSVERAVAIWAEGQAVYSTHVGVSEAVTLLEEAARMHRRDGRIASAALVLVALGLAHSFLRRGRDAVAPLEDAVAYYRLVESKAGLSAALHALGKVHAELDEIDVALPELMEAMETAASIGDVSLELSCSALVGIQHLRKARIEAAAATVDEGLRRLSSLLDPSPSLWLLIRTNAVAVEMVRERWTVARQMARENREVARNNGLTLREIESLAAIGSIELKSDPAAARALFDEAWRLAEPLGNPYLLRLQASEAIAAGLAGDMAELNRLRIGRADPIDRETELLWALADVVASPASAPVALDEIRKDPAFAESDLLRFTVSVVATRLAP